MTVNNGTQTSVVVPYRATNSTVRARAVHWIERLEVDDNVAIYGPGFQSGLPDGGDVLLLRNVRRVTTGRAEERLLRHARPGVYDIDDGLPWDDGRLVGHAARWKRAIPLSRVARRAATAADRVIAGNEVLAEWASDFCDDVRIVPTCVEPSDYQRRTSWTIDDQPVIGWIGSPATELYVSAIASALAQVAALTGARFEMVSGPGELDPALAGFTTRIDWHPSVISRIADWDVGIMPLADGVYERAKCGYKLLQYAAAGVPAVASPVGVNRSIVAAMDGCAATTNEEWVDALTSMLSESAARREQRADAGRIVADDYSYERWQDRWLDAVGWQGLVR